MPVHLVDSGCATSHVTVTTTDRTCAPTSTLSLTLNSNVTGMGGTCLTHHTSLTTCPTHQNTSWPAKAIYASSTHPPPWSMVEGDRSSQVPMSTHEVYSWLSPRVAPTLTNFSMVAPRTAPCWVTSGTRDGNDNAVASTHSHRFTVACHADQLSYHSPVTNASSSISIAIQMPFLPKVRGHVSSKDSSLLAMH
jgi:hypothetical protein